MMNAPLRPGTRPVGAAQLAVKDTSTNGPVFAATPKGDGPRPQDRRGGVRTTTYLRKPRARGGTRRTKLPQPTRSPDAFRRRLRRRMGTGRRHTGRSDPLGRRQVA